MAPRLNSELRLNARPQAVFRLLPGGPALTLQGAGILGGSWGETLTCTRATSKRVVKSDGTVVEVTSGNPGVGARGLLVEAEATNLALQSRDLSQAVWTKTGLSAALTATGVDGAANSASTLTATSANGTATQALVTSGSRTTSFYVKRRTGSGDIQVTRDNGTSWTTLSSSNCRDMSGTAAAPNSSGWVRCTLNSTVTDPTIGIRLVTSGDAVDVDFWQDEDGAFATSPIPAAATSATRNADVISASAANLPTTAGTVELDFTPAWSSGSGSGSGEVLLDTRNSGTGNGILIYVTQTSGVLNFGTYNGGSGKTTASSGLSWTNGTTYRIRAEWRGGNAYVYRNNVLVGSTTDGTAPMPSSHSGSLRIGCFHDDTLQPEGFISNLTVRR